MTNNFIEETAEIDDIIFKIEDYVGGNIEGVETVDRMGFTAFLRTLLTNAFTKQEEHFKQRLLEILPEEMSLSSRNGDFPEGWNACLAEIRKRAGL